MTYEEIKEFFNKKVVLTDIDGKMFDGIITNTVSEFDTSSGKEEIDMLCSGYELGIPLDEIESVEFKK